MNANIRTIGGSIGSAAMASIVTSQLAPSGLPLESGYTTGFAVMTGGLVLAALAGLLIPAVRRLRSRPRRAGAGRDGHGRRRAALSCDWRQRVTGTRSSTRPGRAARRRPQLPPHPRRGPRRARRVGRRGQHGGDRRPGGVGVGTVYRRFASKDALIDELVRLAMEEMTAAAEQALARADGHGLEEFLRALGQSFADHARYANLLLERPADPARQPAAARRGRRAHRAGRRRPARWPRASPPPTSWRWSGPCAAWCRTPGDGPPGLAAVPRHPPGRPARGVPAGLRAFPQPASPEL